MGNALSSSSAGGRCAYDVTSECETMVDASGSCESEVEEYHDTIDADEARTRAKEEEMEEFRRELKIKREQRREILDRHKAEKEELEKSLEKETKAKLETYETNRVLRDLLIRNNIEIPENLQPTKETADISNTIVQMKEEFERFKSNNNNLRRDLAESNKALQGAYSDIADLNSQNTESIKQIGALKEVVSVSKTMINLREEQLNELKNKLNEIEKSLADREANMLSTDLRQEYERQLQNIRTLRTLYEERARLAEVTRLGLLREVEEQKSLKQVEIDKCKHLTAKVEELEANIDGLYERIENKNNQIASCQDVSHGLQAEMAVVHKLFSQVLLGYKTKQDLDKLVHRLEENHGLLTHMAEKENGSEASSALPKLLLELVSQVEEENKENNVSAEMTVVTEDKATEESVSGTQSSLNTSAEEIVQNLPKVWRVLMELLSHQSTPEENSPEKVTTCYKSVETKSGPVLVPSVSQTYIRLKDLIIEKLALNKEVNRMKQLNVHLETRLGEQERRLCLVTTELSKTWHVVGRLRKHHHQLHTHEKILKYELHQKRKLLNELKEELEYCREKWEQAREKNSQSERDLKKLRTEFSSRKIKTIPASLNNSAESGYSDERPSDDSSESNDEREYVTEPLVKSKKKIKKSFETVVDSSTDINLVAEREDPASDMLDVADLPLDTQDGDDNHESCISDSCNSESLLKSERICEETEDEMGEITNDSCVEELSIAERCESSDNSITKSLGKENVDSTSNGVTTQIEDIVSVSVPSSSTLTEIPPPNVVTIDPAAILKSIREQNERLANKDHKLDKLEKRSAALLKQTQATTEMSKLIDSTLDHLMSRPSAGGQSGGRESRAADQNVNENLQTSNTTAEEAVTIEQRSYPNTGSSNTEKPQSSNDLDKSQSGSSTHDDIKCTLCDESKSIEPKNGQVDSIPEEGSIGTINSPNLEPTSINEKSVKEQENLQNIEAGCSNNLENNTFSSDDVCQGSSNEVLSAENTPVSRDGSEPSTSSEIDHEARFAARDIRLKRLEEQTKCLVNKVNKTTTKGVKINYKLDELHNIYGSESSRAGTPSEDNEELPNDDEESQK